MSTMMTKTQSALSIRPFDESSDADYEVATEIRNAALPEYCSTAEEMKDHDSRRDAKCRNGRWLAEVGGRPAALSSYGQSPWGFHPQRFWIGVTVLPEMEGQGIGAALYQHLLREMEALSPTTLRCSVREDMARAHRFALDRGFVEDMREWESRLDVGTFDPTPWEEARRRPAQSGIAIRSLRELESDPDRDRKLWDLESETFRDVPSTIELTPPPFDIFQKNVLESPNLLPDGYIIAVDETTGTYVGSSGIWKRSADDHLSTGLTGVRRAYRRMGIALAMKLRVIDYARSVGAPVIRTENASTNRPMLSINEALGFVKQPIWIHMVKRLADGEEAVVSTAAASAGRGDAR